MSASKSYIFECVVGTVGGLIIGSTYTVRAGRKQCRANLQHIEDNIIAHEAGYNRGVLIHSKKWRDNEIREQKEWLNMPFYRQILSSPPPPPPFC